MTNPVERERIARETAEELGYTIDSDGRFWKYREYPDSHPPKFAMPDWLSDSTRDALIDARCRIQELEATVKLLVER